jgi:hypothetical protein
MSGRFRDCIDPKRGYANTYGFITNGRGIGFSMHKSTRPKEYYHLVEFLDALAEALGEEKVDEITRKLTAKWRKEP